MCKLTSILTTLMFLGLVANLANAAESHATQTIAGILLKLQHVPTADDKQALRQVADDKASTADERTLAQALMNVQHMAAAGDKPALEAIVGDAKAAAAAKTLAGVILGLHHFPSPDDKSKLQALTQ